MESNRLFRFERGNVLRITNDSEHISEHSSMRNRPLSPLYQVRVNCGLCDGQDCMQSSTDFWINFNRA